MDVRLVPLAIEQEALERARELRVSGMGYASVARMLNAEGRPAKRGGAWAAMSVRSVLRTSASIDDAA